MTRKLDPRTKLFLLIVINVVMMTGKISGVFFYVRLAMVAIPFVLMLKNKMYSGAGIYVAMYTYVFALEGYTMESINGVLLIIILFTTGMVSRFLAGGMMAYLVMKTTTVSEFVTAMERMHVPKVIVIPFAVIFRFFPTIKEEWQDIRYAMKMRGIGAGGKNIMQTLEYVTVPMAMSVSKIADELSAASMTKCLSVDGKRTHIAKVGFSWPDLIFALCAIGALAMHIFYGGAITG
ncbi:MAG: energy-coupling factor transporter transmembrane protein EcfT [Lachnospiraceae bacterium]|nr:energy-coupling factor transporter transmembrane protein EcfT [Lachnospiraceae bacterium]